MIKNRQLKKKLVEQIRDIKVKNPKLERLVDDFWKIEKDIPNQMHFKLLNLIKKASGAIDIQDQTTLIPEIEKHLKYCHQFYVKNR